MTKITYHLSIINQDIIPNLNASMENITKAINVMNNTYIPSRFRYATYLGDFQNFLYDRSSKIDNIKFLINKNNAMYDGIETSSNNELTLIADMKVSKRDSAVRNI